MMCVIDDLTLFFCLKVKRIDTCSLHIFNLLDLLVDDSPPAISHGFTGPENIDRRANKRYNDDTALMPYPSYHRSRSNSVRSSSTQLNTSQQTNRYNNTHFNSYYSNANSRRPRGGAIGTNNMYSSSRGCYSKRHSKI